MPPSRTRTSTKTSSSSSRTKKKTPNAPTAAAAIPAVTAATENDTDKGRRNQRRNGNSSSSRKRKAATTTGTSSSSPPLIDLTSAVSSPPSSVQVISLIDDHDEPTTEQQVKKKKTKRSSNDSNNSNNNKTKKIKKAEEEATRLFRYRTKCPSSLHDRFIRATTQRMYLIHQQVHDGQSSDVNDNNAATAPAAASAAAASSSFDNSSSTSNNTNNDIRMVFTVLGSTGNVYTVTIHHLPRCTCPDFARNQDCCKHIIFVLLKVIGISMENPLAYQKAYITSELLELQQLLLARRVGGGTNSVMANERVREAVLNSPNTAAANKKKTDTSTDDDTNQDSGNNTGVVRRSLEASSESDDNNDCDCPVCFDPMDANKMHLLTYCRAACGSNFHIDCIVRWLQNCPTKSCPYCRQTWIGPEMSSTGGKKKSSTGTSRVINRDAAYMNLAELQGLSRTRDTSTYNSYFNRYH